MNFGNGAFDLAAKREQEEREALIADAAHAVKQKGSVICCDCDRPIPEARRLAAPFARRCIQCQTIHEEEKYHR
ncbi:molecular chaperone DnaK [Pseudorhizobium halotolerans]|uniref:Molecular chaperone DnaK n=1 Tax=Pseudorhizobium halotolerans TaxID=1233081 RepID=A0ABN7JZI8_9HYPH|nr:TraR/DksA C4-type zinc finger protein [Pseudorhizobium halotolerans]CAD7055379.1 molecular chaperone DnaK [Pseudorhizobium halotolerans]